MNKVNICFVVLHYNTIEDTERFIVSVFENIDVDSFQIVIVDNASPNRSGEILKEKYRENDKVSVILNSTNKGFARGNNTGIKYAEKNFDPDFIVMTNSDTYLIQKDFYYQIQKEYDFTIILVTHNLNIAEMANTVIKMNSGKISEIYTNKTKKTAYEIGW